MDCCARSTVSRLEGDVRLAANGGITMFDYWKPLLTDVFIDDIRRQGGVLVNLASSEMKDLFDWKRVESEVRVVTPDFQVWKDGRLKTVVVYAKMCRGEMTRYARRTTCFRVGGLCLQRRTQHARPLALHDGLMRNLRVMLLAVWLSKCSVLALFADTAFVQIFRNRSR